MRKLIDDLREPFNCLSHGIGALLALASLLPLFYYTTGAIQYLAVSLYGVSLFLLFSSSAIYHGLDVAQDVLTWLHRMDRAAIYVFIAGTTTPIALIALQGWVGWTMFGLLWGIAVAGVILSAFNPFDSRWSNTLLYLGMGWVSIVFIGPLVNTFSLTALSWCVAGGLLYTVGACVYAFDWPVIHAERFGAHELWHIFVMLGSGSHYVFIAGYTI